MNLENLKNKFKHQSFKDDQILIINADCSEVIKEMGEKSIDLVLTDPPYVYQDYSPGNKGFDEKQENIDFIKSISKGFDVNSFNEFKKKGKFMNIFCCCSTKQVSEIMNWGMDNKYQTNLLVWKKGGRPFGITYLHDVEFIVHIRETGSPFNGAYQSRVLEYISKRENGHPTEKPLALFNKLVGWGTKENDLVFDGFCGAGTAAISCLKLNRKFIGVEIENKYFDVACKRIETELKQLNLFG